MEITKMSTALRDSIDEYRAIGYKLEGLAKEWAQAESDYNVASTRVKMKLKSQGESSTYIEGIVRGLPEIADLKYKRDLAQEVLKANHKLLSVLGDSMSATQSLLKYHSEL